MSGERLRTAVLGATGVAGRQAIEAQEDSTLVQVDLVRRDTVMTTKFTATGTISPKEFKIQSKFGQLTVRLSDIQKAYDHLEV